jgi:hypothetical protein
MAAGFSRAISTQLPKMPDGAVKTVAPSTIVLMLTGWGQRLVADGDIPARVDRVLGKPPKMRELREALAACLEARTLGP